MVSFELRQQQQQQQRVGFDRCQGHPLLEGAQGEGTGGGRAVDCDGCLELASYFQSHDDKGGRRYFQCVLQQGGVLCIQVCDYRTGTLSSRADLTSSKTLPVEERAPPYVRCFPVSPLGALGFDVSHPRPHIIQLIKLAFTPFSPSIRNGRKTAAPSSAGCHPPPHPHL